MTMQPVAISHHVRNRSQADVIARLSASHNPAFVFPRSTSGWVTFVTERDDDSSMQHEVPGFEAETILHYRHAKDRFWGFAISWGKRSRMDFQCDWSRPDAVALSSSVESQLLLKLCRAELSAQQIWELNRLLGLDSAHALREEEPFLKVPKLLGLEWFDAMSFETLYRDPEWSLARIPRLQWLAVP